MIIRASDQSLRPHQTGPDHTRPDQPAPTPTLHNSHTHPSNHDKTLYAQKHAASSRHLPCLPLPSLLPSLPQPTLPLPPPFSSRLRPSPFFYPALPPLSPPSLLPNPFFPLFPLNPRYHTHANSNQASENRANAHPTHHAPRPGSQTRQQYTHKATPPSTNTFVIWITRTTKYPIHGSTKATQTEPASLLMNHHREIREKAPRQRGQNSGGDL